MSDLTGVFKPKSYAIRDPLSNKKMHGQVSNPPRMNQMGGLDKLKEPNGHFKNEMTLKKPGGTTSSSKK